MDSKKGTPPQWCSGDAGPQSLQRRMGSNAMLSLAPRLDLSNTSLISSPRVRAVQGSIPIARSPMSTTRVDRV